MYLLEKQISSVKILASNKLDILQHTNTYTRYKQTKIFTLVKIFLQHLNNN